MHRIPRAAVLVCLLLASVAALAQEILAPPSGVIAEGLPPIAAALGERLKPYGEFVGHQLVAWHPVRREMLVNRRTTGSPQLHVVAEPGVRPVPLADLSPPVVAEWNRAVDPPAAVARAIARLEGSRFAEFSASDDGRRIAYVEVASPIESHLWVMEVATGKRRRVTPASKGDPVSYRLPRFMKDGRSLLATSDRGSEYRRIVQVPLAGGAERVLTEHLKYDIDDLQVSPDGARVAFTSNEGGSHSLRFLDGKTLKEQPRPPLFNGVISDIAWRPGSAEVGFQLASARSAGDVFTYEVEENKLARWTNGNNPNVNVSTFPEPRVVRWKSIDGIESTALHYPPSQRHAGKRPVLVDLRGGPGSQARAAFIGERNYLVTELGIAVVYPSLRGAPGFGKTFRRLGIGPRRDETAREIAALLDWIRAQPDLDADRVLLAGSGAGATIALASAVEHAARIAGVVAVLPSSIPAGTERLPKPAFIVVGRADPSASPAREAATALKSRGVTAWILEVEASGPGLLGRTGADFLAGATVEFAQKVLLR